jgi:hypothetical protein
LAELLLQKPFFLESTIKYFLNIWLYNHRKNKHHIFFKSRVSLPELNAKETIVEEAIAQWLKQSEKSPDSPKGTLREREIKSLAKRQQQR